jgi:uncharacterized protein YheU (UPF0270 family)
VSETPKLGRTRTAAGDAGGNPTEPVIVPHTALSPELLRSVVESFVLREGTDYGLHELALDEKVHRVIAQLERGRAQIVFDPEFQTVSIVVPGA